jgi:hypothetical protein
MIENTNFEICKLTKWLRVLMYIAIVSLVNSIVNYVPFVPASVTTWISRAIMVAMIVCMFRLASANGRYKTAAILRAIWLGTLLLGTLLHIPSVLVLSTSILSIIAVYQEYHGHSEVLAEKDTVLSAKWKGLFIWSIIAPLLLSIGSSAAMVISSFMNLDVAKVTAITTGIMRIPQYVIDVIYLLYLKKMLSIFENNEVN